VSHPAPSLLSSAQPGGLRRAAGLATLSILVALVAGYLPRWRQAAASREETRDLAIPTVAVVLPTPGKAGAELLMPAEIKPWLEAPIHARANGYLKRWFVDLGARVEAGQLLAEIETPELSQEVEGARAQLLQAEAALALAGTTAARWTDAARTASVSEQDSAEKEGDLARAAAAADAARANVRRVENMLSYARVRAPFAGTVTARNIDVGDLIAAGGGRELFRLAQTDRVRVYVRVPEAAARGVMAGRSAELLVPEIPGRAFGARVVRTAGAIAAASRTLLVELEADDPQGELLAGGFGQVRFAESAALARLTVPSNALLFRSEGPQLAIVMEDGAVEVRSVTLGRDYGTSIEVVAGVGAEDRVILNPADSLVSGTTVRVAAAAKTGERQ
jgi:RND family efflux transporter MFP subunit